MHPVRHVHYGIVIAAGLCCVLLFSSPAAAQGSYFNGVNQNLSNVCPITSTFEPAALTTFTGYFTNVATNLPSTGDTVYIHAYAVNGSACSNDTVGFEFFLPEGASFDISGTNPVYCIRGRFDNSVVENVPNDANGACSQTPGAGTFGGAFFGWTALPAVGNWWLEIRVPVRFNKQLLGLAGPASHQIQVVTSSIHGNVVPVQAVTVFYRAQFDSFATTAITSTGATEGFNLYSYFHAGNLFIDTGTSNPPPANPTPTAITATSLGYVITNPLTGLSPGTTYFWRARYVTTDGTFTTPVQSFATTGGGPQTLTVSKSGTGAGTVASSPAGISCGATCSASFAFNQSVTLTAVASGGSTFAGWSGSGCSGTGTCSVTMSAAKSVTAQFTASSSPFTVSVSKVGTGAGTVTSSPAGISCGATCSASFSSGSSVTLTAAASSGSTFAGWSGGGCSGTGTCTVSVAASVSAQFTRQIGSLSVTLDGLPAGTTAALAITGPDGYNATQTVLTGTGVNLSDVVTGTYTVTPPTVTVSSSTYTASVQSATVTFGGTATINIVYTLQTGGAPARAGDYDGDGKSDMAVYKSTGDWAILKSSSAFASSLAKSWGGAGYTAVTGDYDGDGKQDLALYRGSTGEWLMLIVVV